MKRQIQNLLSRKILTRVALTSKFSKNSPKVLKYKRFRRLKSYTKFIGLGFLLLFFTGYYPAWDFPPVRNSTALAEEQTLQTQKAEVIASSFPQGVKLPHGGYLSNRFSNYHPGIDIATEIRTPVYPVTEGTITEVNFGFWGYGNHVIISHPNNFKSLYGHLGRVFVENGQEVTTDSILGEVGMTGFSSGPHTHLEIIHDNKYIDPQLILPAISDMPRK